MPDKTIQKQITELYLLFPEYIDAQHPGSAIYIHTIGSVPNGNVPTEVDDVLNKMEWFGYEVCDKYFDGMNVLNVVHPYTDWVYPSVESSIYARLQAGGCLDWREQTGRVAPSLTWNGTVLGNDTSSQVYHRGKIDNASLKCHAILLATSSVLDKLGFLATLKDGLSRKVSIAIAQSVRDLYNWFMTERLPQRRYDYNAKHGENRTEKRMVNNEWVCPLRCNGQQAQALLEKAIGDKGKYGSLWFYDANQSRYIYFENQVENPQPAFHAYHVEPGDDNYDHVNPKKLDEVYP